MAASVPFSERYLLKYEALRMPAGNNLVLIAIRRAIPHSDSFSKRNNNHFCFASDDVLDLSGSDAAYRLELTRQSNPARPEEATTVHSRG